MPTLANHREAGVIKMLLIGDSGTGKTGALASLATMGYRLMIQDYDNGLDSLAFRLKDTKAPNHYQTLTDRLKSVNGTIMADGIPSAFARGLNLLDHWKGTEDGQPFDFGKPKDWDFNTVLVIDSLTFMSAAAMRYVMAVNGRYEKPQLQDWGAAMEKIEGALGILYSDTIKCHVIITSHISYVEGEDGLSRGYPSTLGQKLPPKVGRYFNTILQAKVQGSGPGARRVIRTVPDSVIPLKSPVPNMPPELPLETGLADFFKIAAKAPALAA